MSARAVRGTVLMDLDGTISDPAIGVYASFRHALACVGYDWPDDRPLKWIVGPPLRESFKAVLDNDDLAAQALTHYRTHYAAGALYQNTLYPGITEAIDSLDSAGFRLYVATSKLTEFAERIIDNFGLRDRFAGVFGSSPDGRIEEKAEVVAHCLAVGQVDPKTCVMVGDREHDAIGAAANGIPCIGVTWGYGSADELRAAGVALICETPGSLAHAVEQVLAGTHFSAMTAKV